MIKCFGIKELSNISSLILLSQKMNTFQQEAINIANCLFPINGSSLLFWRFYTKEAIRVARDGWKIFWKDDSIPYPLHKQQQKKMKQDLAEQLAVKISDAWKKNYISPGGTTINNIDYFLYLF